MKADKTFSGVTPDHGTIMRVQQRTTSLTTAAISESLSIYESDYLGGHIRPVRRAVFIDRPMYGLSMMENNIPLIEVKLNTALTAFKPYDALTEFDAVLEQMGGATHAPCITVIPCTTLLANGYKFADSLVQSQNAWYQDYASWLTNTSLSKENKKGKFEPLHSVIYGNKNHAAMPVFSSYVKWSKAVTIKGIPSQPRVSPYGSGQVILLPSEGEGPMPFLVPAAQMGVGDHMTPMVIGDDSEDGVTLGTLVPLRWGIFYQEQDVELDSPVRKLAMIAMLNYYLDYLDGNTERNPYAGSHYQWPAVNGTKSPPYGTAGKKTFTGHDVLNSLLAGVARAAALRLEYMTADELPQSMELQVIRSIANLLFFLDHKNLFINALVNTSSIRQFVTLLLESQLVQTGAVVEMLAAKDKPSVEVYDLQAGVAPPQAVSFLWRRIISLLPPDAFNPEQMQAIRKEDITFVHRLNGEAPTKSKTKKKGEPFVTVDKDNPQDTIDAVTELLMTADIARVKSLAKDMRADYVAAAFLARLRESVPVVTALLRGELPGFEHIHTNFEPLSVEVAADILDCVQLMLDRDLLAGKDVLAWEEPYTGAHFSTQWQAYSVRFPTYPVDYVIHDMAIDYLSELSDSLDVIDGDQQDPGSITQAVANAFSTVGVSLIQCEPAMTYIPLAAQTDEEREHNYAYPTAMKGEYAVCGRERIHESDALLYGDIPVSHGALSVTSTYYVRSATIWNQLMEMPRQVTARAYNPQVVPCAWHDYALLQCTDEQLKRAVGNDPKVMTAAKKLLGVYARQGAVGWSHPIDLNPAFRDVPIVLPYVQMFIQTPPDAYAFSMYSRVAFETDQHICNLAGTPIVLSCDPGIPGVEPWKIPNLAQQMAYHAMPVTHMVLPLTWNAVR